MENLIFASVTLAELCEMVAPGCPCPGCNHPSESCEDECDEFAKWFESLEELEV